MTESQTNTPNDTPITFYSKTGCPWCNAVRHLLNEHKVSYEERNVREDSKMMDRLRQETGQDGTPTLRIGNDWLVDTDAKEVARRLGLPEPAEVKMAA